MEDNRLSPPETAGSEDTQISDNKKDIRPHDEGEGASLRDAQRAKRKEARRNEPLKKRLFWWAVYALIAVMMAAGIYMIVIQYVYVGDSKPYETPPAYTPIAATPLPAPTPVATDDPAAQTPVVEASPDPTPTPAPTPVIPLAPVQVTLVKPEIQCDIEPVGAENGEMGSIDSGTIIAWYRDGMAPNEDGNCILNGHVRWNGKMGAFSYLNEMEEGEEVVLKLEDGSYRYYKVHAIEEHPYDDFPPHLLSSDGMHRLTLITCKGDYDNAAGTSLTRTVVICKPMAEVRG